MGIKQRQTRAKPTVTSGGQELDDEQRIDECEELLEQVLEDRLPEGAGFEDYEKTLIELVHEIARRKLEKKVQATADSFADRLLISYKEDWHGVREGTVFEYRRHASGTVTYHSLVGPLRVRRDTYREKGRYGTSYVPVELEAGLIERMTPALAKSVAIGHAYMSPRQCKEFMVASGLQPPSRSTLDRAARDVGAYAVACQEEIEPLVRANEVVDPKARTIALGLDRTAVPMRHGECRSGVTEYGPDLRNSRPTPKKRAQIRGPVQWRMDYVGTFSLLDEAGEPLVTRKYRLPGEADPAGIVERLMADVRRALEQRPLEVAVVQDGAPELWKLMNTALDQETLVPTWTQVLDWYHVDERLSRCLDLCTMDSTRALQRKRWHTRLLEQESGIKQVIRSLRRSARNLEGKAAKELGDHINYFVRNKQRAAYAVYRRSGIPIGSGITEGACKSVVGARAKRSGQRWSQRGLSAALHLRAIHQSDRFNSFWSFFARRYRARHIVGVGAQRA